MAIDQEHLLFGSDLRNTALDKTVLQHPRECVKIFQQCLHEGLRLFLIHVLFDVMFTHESANSTPAKTQPHEPSPKHSPPGSPKSSRVATDARPTRDKEPAVTLDRRLIQTMR